MATLRLEIASVTALLLVGARPAAGQQWVALDGPSQSGRGAAFDSHRGRLVAFGNDGGTWEWDGSRWLSRPVAIAPVPRTRHSMVYDPVRRHTLMFGGQTPNGVLGDTWAWDGAEWRALPSAARPAFLVDQTAAFDEVRGCVVMFNCVDRTTWQHDGSQWQQLAPATAPPSLPMVCMAFDPVRGVTLLFAIGNGVEFWQWNGLDWSSLPAPGLGLVGSRAGYNAAFDRARQRLVVFEPLISPLETWEWDGSVWWRLPTGNVTRLLQAMYFDARSQQVVLQGGFEDPYWHSDQWGWNGNAWTLVAAEHRPFARGDMAVGHDPRRGRTLLFGGSRSIYSYDDTWEWDGLGWSRLSPAVRPRYRRGASMCFDPTSGRLALFGGTTNLQQLDDLWFWDGVTWSATAPSLRPRARIQAGLCADSARNRLMLFGGQDAAGQALGDTWEWDGTTWASAIPATAPPARSAVALAYDPVRQFSVLFGGLTGTTTSQQVWRNDTWQWNGSNWQAVQPVAVPSVMRTPSSVFDPTRGRVVLVGLSDTQPIRFETWDFDGTTWNQSPVQGIRPAEPLRLVHDAARGRNVVFDGNLVLELSPTPATVTAHGAGCGTPLSVLACRSRPRTGETAFGLELHVQPAQPVLFGLGTATASMPLGNGCVLAMQPLATLVVVADTFGMAVQPIPVPANHALRGLVLYAQAGVLQPSSPGGFTLSLGLRIDLGD